MEATGPMVGKARSSTFLVEVLFRGNCSLQGEIMWLERRQPRSFRSLLELVQLIWEACEESGAPAADYELRAWGNDEHDPLGEQ